MLLLLEDKSHYPSFSASSCHYQTMCSWTSFSSSHHTALACFVLPLFASIGTPSSLAIASSPAFRHFHGLPVLDVFTNSTRIPRFLPFRDPLNHVSAASFSLTDLHWHVLGCRHSHTLLIGSTRNEPLVWNPINGHECLIPAPPHVDPRFNYEHVLESNATVVCGLCSEPC
ncbi:hypothetical protein C2845_PM02G15690 [Panicum miliaceum]|uniref:Uncharacterized protein n=1 Tax=Panicum miliaceum TaxID=4540 RepID=A0A3L6SH73_PANMI|nr:hypothetical protein C2845_PM02G15690 [Panicum miliaceum]